MTNIERFTSDAGRLKTSSASLAKVGKNDFGHQWITVVNPTNHSLLLQACDNCGVVKSENSVVRRCSMPKGQKLISAEMSRELQETA